MKLWIVFKFNPRKRNRDQCPNCEGVFDTEAKAVRACKTCYYTVCPVTLNRHLPDEDRWPGAYYPIHPTMRQYLSRKRFEEAKKTGKD